MSWAWLKRRWNAIEADDLDLTSDRWYIGVIAAKFGGYGGDGKSDPRSYFCPYADYDPVGNQLALVFTLVTYIPARYLELKYVGR